MKKSEKTHYKSIFISDTHLGTKGCKADLLNDFLKNHTCDKLYLVGDIVDGWRLKKNFYFPQSHSNVIRSILSYAKRGTKVFYIVGNHDEVLRKWLHWNLRFGKIKISNNREHISANGKKYLVVHGDMFDGLMHANLKWIMHIGDYAYNFLLWVNNKFNQFRSFLGRDYWSLSKYIKGRTKQALNFIDGFETKLSEYAKKKKYDGVICGHIHTAAIKDIDGIHYINTGDWVESCTAIVENDDGEFQLIEWKNRESE